MESRGCYNSKASEGLRERFLIITRLCCSDASCLKLLIRFIMQEINLIVVSVLVPYLCQIISMGLKDYIHADLQAKEEHRM